jgi:hypothetical protein
MKIDQYISDQLPERLDILTSIHQAIIDNDKTVEAVIEPMMGKEMIIYKARGMMKYALSAVKNYMSLHVLPMYMNEPIHTKYKELLPQASFQKGCINFTSGEEIPIAIVQDLIIECSPIDLAKIREDYLNSKKGKKAKA